MLKYLHFLQAKVTDLNFKKQINIYYNIKLMKCDRASVFKYTSELKQE